jgi:hypothetical protein
MKRRRIYGLLLGGIVIAASAGLRIDIGQGYSDPIVRPAGRKVDADASQRTLEVRLKNRNTGRPQYYEWSLSVPPHGSVEIECHEWMHVRLFGRALFGAPRNGFSRIIPLDVPDEGLAEPYDYVIRWRHTRA